jgi:hypothetical protein
VIDEAKVCMRYGEAMGVLGASTIQLAGRPAEKQKNELHEAILVAKEGKVLQPISYFMKATDAGLAGLHEILYWMLD